MSENITGGILSAETESMTFFLFGVKIRYAGALSNPRIKKKGRPPPPFFNGIMHEALQ